MTPTITTEDREAAEKYLVKRFPSYENDKSVMHIDVEVFNAGITHVRSQPDSEFQKGVASVQSQLTEARERLRVACELLESAKGWARTHAMQTYSKVASKEADEIEEFLAQIQEPNGKKGG